jgi:post-segregation antitoxin (ccd killing protein)
MATQRYHLNVSVPTAALASLRTAAKRRSTTLSALVDQGLSQFVAGTLTQIPPAQVNRLLATTRGRSTLSVYVPRQLVERVRQRLVDQRLPLSQVVTAVAAVHDPLLLLDRNRVAALLVSMGVPKSQVDQDLVSEAGLVSRAGSVIAQYGADHDLDKFLGTARRYLLAQQLDTDLVGRILVACVAAWVEMARHDPILAQRVLAAPPKAAELLVGVSLPPPDAACALLVAASELASGDLQALSKIDESAATFEFADLWEGLVRFATAAANAGDDLRHLSQPELASRSAVAGSARRAVAAWADHVWRAVYAYNTPVPAELQALTSAHGALRRVIEHAWGDWWTPESRSTEDAARLADALKAYPEEAVSQLLDDPGFLGATIEAVRSLNWDRLEGLLERAEQLVHMRRQLLELPDAREQPQPARSLKRPPAPAG